MLEKWSPAFHLCISLGTLEFRHNSCMQLFYNMVLVFYNKLSWFMFELPEKDISNVVVQCRQLSKVSCRGLCLNYLKKISQAWRSSVGNILQ